MVSVQVLLATLIIICRAGMGQVSFDPDGPLLIPINTQRTVNCSSTEGFFINSWFVILSDGTEVGTIAAQGNVQRFGITATFMPPLLQLIVNTPNTSVVGLRCVGVVTNDATDIIRRSEAKINLTIYGVPDPSTITSLSLEGNSLRSSWDYVRIPTVDVTLYWSLSFFRPSQLSNMTTTLLNTNTFNYTLQGVRSCDPFRLCITARNEVGNSSWSCNNSALPYIPQSEDIKLFLVRVNEAFSLNVTVLVPQECQSSMNSYTLKVTNAEGNKVAMPPCRSDDKHVHLLVEDLNESSSYNFTIISSNSIGEQSTAAIPFNTTTSSNGSPSNSGSGLSAGAIAAIAVAVCIIFILVATLIITHSLIKIGYCCGEASAKIKRHQNNHQGGVKFTNNGEGLPDAAIGSGNQRGNVPDVAMNADQQDGVSSQEPFYSTLNTTKPAVKVAAPVTTAGGNYAKINQEPVYFVLENNGQNKALPKEVIPADKDASPVPEYNPVDDIPAAIPAPPPPVVGDITSSAQPEAMYAEISTRSAPKL